MKRLKSLSVKTKLLSLAGLFVCGMAVFGMVSYSTVSEVKIGGAAYNQIKLLTDAIADFLPPPQFLIQENLQVYRMGADIHDKDRLTKDVDVLKGLMKDYEDGHGQWRAKLSDPTLLDLMEKVYEPGHAYLELAWNKYLPLIQQGNGEEAERLRLSEMRPQFALHEAAIKHLVRALQEQATKVEKNAGSMVASRTFVLIVVALASVSIVLTLSLLVASGILTPLKATVQMLHEVSQGNLTRRMDIAGTDEIAQMGNALNETVENLSRVMSEINADAEVLSNAAKELTTTSQQLGANSQQTDTQAAAVSAAAEEVSQNVQTVSTATEEMSASIKEISKNASEAAEVASSAARLAGTTNATMTKLSESSAEIGNVIKVITSIAEQTNLLALNATIEAARAGEAGKGFAVVANEVKELAKETAKATEDIGSKVQAIQNDAKGAVQAIDEITTVIGRINDIQNTIASAVEEQTGTTNEISRNVAETAKGSSDIASNITGVAQAAKETLTSAGIAQHSAEELSKVAISLNAVVGKFKLSTNGHPGHAFGTVR